MRTFILSLFIILIFSHVKSQEIKNYDFEIKIDVKSEKIHVKGNIDIDFNGKDTALMILWKYSDISSITFENTPVKYYFDTASPSSNMYIPDGKNLFVFNPAKDKKIQSLLFDYECDMNKLNGWAKSFTESWIEMNFYSAWFPLNSNKFTSKFKIWIDGTYRLTGSGTIRQKEGYWEMEQPWPSFDNVIIASKNLKSKTLKDKNVFIGTDYSDFPETDADSIIAECRYVLKLYERLFGKKDSTYLKFVITPVEKGGGYSRKNFVSMGTKNFNLYTTGGIAHEIAHFWWSNATASTWEDWLNESFAEYSMLVYFLERYGKDVFYSRIEQYKTRSANTPPIWGINRNSPEAYTVLYEKGALLLCELEEKTGKDKFHCFLKEISVKKVDTTAEFLDMAEKSFSIEIRNWIEEGLKM